MSKFLAVTFTMVLFAASVGTAGAESIKGRLGITGQLGFMVPSNSEYDPNFINAVAASTGSTLSSQLKVDSNFAGGGGLIYGLTDNLALEAHVIYTPEVDIKNAGAKVLQLDTTNASLGFQLRSNLTDEDMAAYIGGGVDVLISNVEDSSGVDGKVSTVVGGHVNAGGDYFLTKSWALNLDLRGVFFPDADIKGNNGIRVAQYNPISFVALFGVRFFIN
jgi:outer membrane protein